MRASFDFQGVRRKERSENAERRVFATRRISLYYCRSDTTVTFCFRCSDAGRDSHRHHTRLVVAGPGHVRVGRGAHAVRGHRQGRADVQLGVRHRRDGGRGAGRLRVRHVRLPDEHDAVRGVPVGRLDHADGARVPVDAVRRPRDAGRGRGGPVRRHTVVRGRDIRVAAER